MKKTLLFLILFNFGFFGICESPVKSFNSQQQIKITIIDNVKKEPLTGVLNKIHSNYSDFKGNMIISNGDSVDLQFISYESLKIKVHKDTTIILKEISVK